MAVEEITQKPTLLSPSPRSAEVKDIGFSKNSQMASAARALDGPDAAPEADYSFWDFLDLINPLQHIPVVNSLYREVTGDTIKPEMKLAGGVALGGVFGFVTSLADVIFEQETGKDIGSTVVAGLFGTDAPAATASTKMASTQEVEQATRQMAALNTPLPVSMPNSPAARKDTHDARDQRLAMIDPMDKHVLDLYGKSNPTVAAKAYHQADMRGYLQQASVNQAF